MEFKSARAIEQITWQMRLADYSRSLNRARIASLANGAPPYPDDEASDNGAEININDLSLTRLSHDARLQLYSAFNKPGNFFTARTDMGAQNKRAIRSNIVTSEITKKMKRSDVYYQCMLSKFANLVLHGPGPSYWQNTDKWCPTPLEVADVMMPSKTLTTFENLPFFAIWRSYTAMELKRLTRNPERNPGWNMPVVENALSWCDEQTAAGFAGSPWSDYWVPEKRTERFKEDSGVYASDLVQTIDCWDFYYWDDKNKHEGWRRKIVFDAEGGNGAWAARGKNKMMPDKNLIGERGQFLYDSKDRVVADNINQLIHFQFADLSAVAPFRYHSVRSLGFLLYAVCHLQNRLNCAFSEAVFENLMMYMRVKSLDEAERALKVELINRGFIDESVSFLSPAERWQPNPQLAEMGMQQYQRIISDNSSSYVQNSSLSRDRVEKTKFQVMAEVNAMQSLVSSALQQAYRYQTTEYREIFRRFMKKDSEDPDVRDFRARCLARDVPAKYLEPGAWEIEPERVIGGGNKTLEMAISQQLMDWRSAYAPGAQNEILRMATLAITDDASQTETLVPQAEALSNTRHDAMTAFGALMAGGIVQWKDDQNRVELAETLLVELDLNVKKSLKMGGMASMDKIMGFQNVVQHLSELIVEVAQDPATQQKAKGFAQASGNISNEIKGMAQRLQQQMQSQQGQGGDNGEMAKTLAKVQATKITAEAKAANTRESHAQRTAQREVTFQKKSEQDQQRHAQDMNFKEQEKTLELATEKMKLMNKAAEAQMDSMQQPPNQSED